MAPAEHDTVHSRLLRPVPSYMLGAYDIFHIRAIVTAVVDGNTDVSIKNLISILSTSPVFCRTRSVTSN
jgi:hypothetical protein